MRWIDPGPRRPADVDDVGDVPYRALDVRDGVDTDADGVPDTVLDDTGPDLLLHTDLDGDGWADQVLRIGPDGSVAPVPLAPVDSDPAPGLHGAVLGGTGTDAGPWFPTSS